MARRKSKRQIFEHIEVVDAGAKGKTVAKAPDGRVVFLPNAVPGDVVDVQTFKKRKSYYEGKAIKFHTLSDKRTEPKCEHFGVCGGCKWQHMDYKFQLEFKQKEVTNNLVRIGHLELPIITPILGSTEHYFYRNKMEFSFSDSRWLTQEEVDSDKDLGDRNALGFHIPGMWDKILDINKCWLQADPSNAIRNAVRDFSIENGLAFFNTRQQTGLLRTMMVRTSSTGDLMIVIQFFKDDEKKRILLLDYIAETFPQITSLQYIINGKANDTIYDQDVICYKGNDHIFEEMEGLRFKINAKSFYQTNSDQAYELYKITRDFAGLKGDELVYDLYTGTGTIAQFVAKQAKFVVGVEAVPDAIKAAKENAQLNAIDNVDFYVGDMKNVFNTEFINKNGQPDVIITDPPRDGMHKDVVQQILNIAPEKVVYVSCNSATQARDLALMKDIYKITKTQAVDMFPQTHHVENVVLLEKH
ncbi:23S rRNA (uracil(1939)-C(5))-methyltransferase RlmD [Psychroserpens ponticola]|uniref:23S rRNA (Uracil(1939)-C(5))-methyltransferase RlmD n=1 Tax=Psychroserpens ponticola TaxID=2932268 RepID=A0ABY7S0U6_9FLAO|nr:23S rRNA (uracil(1939)-C(5))-methyltransferase RlmD [Psychroserpens ponticola]WCO03009.1 23S rRNA (uracil(1939)-C(5))-methyltransferase RlmD [Psychroserpens ponticola]